MGRFENIFEIQIPTPFVNFDGYKYNEQGSDAFLVIERHEQQQLTDTSLRRSISDREPRQQVYCTTSVRIGYILINYVVRYTLVFVKTNHYLITSDASLRLAMEKTEVILLMGKRVPKIFNLDIGGGDITTKEEIKYLGGNTG